MNINEFFFFPSNGGKTERISLNDENFGGISVLEDGTRIYWLSGHGGESVIILPDGSVERVNQDLQHPILDRVNELDANGYDINRQATPSEEREFYNIIKLKPAKVSPITKDSLSDDIYDLINKKRAEKYVGELNGKMEKFKKLTGRKPGFAESIAYRLRKLCE